MTKVRGSLLLGAAIVTAIGGLSIPSAHRDRTRATDVGRYRTLIEQFPVLPGAELIEESVTEDQEDGEAIGRFSLTLTYRVPAGSTTAAVISFHRENLPPGWTEVSDETCRASRAMFEQPGGDAFVGEWVLHRRENVLSALVPRSSGPPGGLSFTVEEVAGERQLRVGPLYYGCGVPEPEDPPS